MNREKTLDSIPIDLFLEIFSRLPTYSVGRSRCVSKQWASILGRQDFTELFLTKSSTRPRLFFALQPYHGGQWLLYSLLQPQNPYEKSIEVTADFHTLFPRSPYDCIYSSGLLCFPAVWTSKNKGDDAAPVICNPSTGHYAILPKLRMDKKTRSFLGFDPIDKQFKVLFMKGIVDSERVNLILTLGTEKMRWRNIQCPFTLNPFRLCEGICINGVLYYLAKHIDERNQKCYVIVCFDVRSEKSKFLDSVCLFDQLINYKGKLGGFYLNYASTDGFPLKLTMWVLEDVEKQEWSKNVYTIWDESKTDKVDHKLSVVGMTARGDIVLAEKDTSNLLYVFYFNPERNTLQSIKITGFEYHGKVSVFLDHVEDLNVNDTKILKSSVYAHLQQDRCTFESSNKFDALCLSDDDD
ncbi:F-box domain [Arabidopsis thaliana x Arabidopsis arenosa]|uniref:F-box domain n=1 Tax=Arabidopsis thaliana x Arabidopsis arenosa TaxID=1240361 RepID=A0A8T2C528_9BRAS|nr:F-box domain [Arabidopsis thaliana x Arabidopsis arenosa]